MENTPELREFITSLFVEQSKREKQEKLERYRRLNQFAIPGQILFAGSSLMEQFPIHELLMDQGVPLTVYNRGIGGFTTAELAEVLDVCVYDLRPRHIFLNIGTNDLNGPGDPITGLSRPVAARTAWISIPTCCLTGSSSWTEKSQTTLPAWWLPSCCIWSLRIPTGKFSSASTAPAGL